MKHQLSTLYNQALIMYRQETTMYQQLSTDRSQCTADMPSTSTTYPGHKTSAPLFLDLRPSYCKKHGRVNSLVPKGSVSSGLPYYVQHFTTAFTQDLRLRVCPRRGFRLTCDASLPRLSPLVKHAKYGKSDLQFYKFARVNSPG